MSRLIIEGGGWHAEVLPEAGGLIAALTYKGVDVLRPLPAGSTDPLAAACFPLIPYANRVAGARFSWEGAEVTLPRNFLPEESNLHGLGWQAGWTPVSHGRFKCLLVHEHDGKNGWPWAYRAEQRVMLGERGAAISLTLTNLSDRVMPAGLGLHPYFRRRPESRVQFAATGVALVDRALIPTGKVAPPDHFGQFAQGDRLPGVTIDHCYRDWTGPATISDDLGTMTLTATGARHLHLYAPADGSALCLEPVTHLPNALNDNPASMTLLPPQCSATMRMEIAAGEPVSGCAGASPSAPSRDT